MVDISSSTHDHVFLGEGHEKNERRTWMVIALCSGMMIAEVGGGLLFGSIALIADGLHMSTHASALLLAALAYRYARHYANDARFSFGTGKLGDLAGFSSAIILAMIALLIGYEALTRFIWPVPIHYAEALPIAVLGLMVNVASVLLLSGGTHDHGHSHGHAHLDHDHAHDQVHSLRSSAGPATLEIFEDGVPPRFRLSFAENPPPAASVTIETVRPGGARQAFAMRARGGYLESIEDVPEPHAFVARVTLDQGRDVQAVDFSEHEEHAGSAAQRDNNMRAAIIHVMADAAVSVLVIIGLSLGWLLRWQWTDPVAGLIGATVIAAWSYGLVRDTGAILLDINPDRNMAERMRALIETEGDRLTDLHLWRLGPGHLGAIVSVETQQPREPRYYQTLLRRFSSLSHVTVQVQHR
ncbi:MAG TPA: CDF family Co(II)/Ni(II) efflux transporter DmeF [Xanthobacteraceae bacterium]|nr:CDF family Co(II)/Ni(II) efflux transporter DmeF [Xanthobacteraceae bacterium]